MKTVAFIHVLFHSLKSPPPWATCQHISNSTEEALHESIMFLDIVLSINKHTAKLLPWGQYKLEAEVCV